jgi:hypothetical protein
MQIGSVAVQCGGLGVGTRGGRCVVAGAPAFSVHLPGDPGRGEVEAFIRRVYADHFGARVRQFAPTLVSLREGGAITAAAGYRSGAQPLFLERYLDGPVERLLAGPCEAPARERIFEVGHLAAQQPGEGRRLIPHLARHLEQLQVQWVVSTATQELRRIFTRLGVRPVTLGAADPARLGEGARDWGSYYAHHPLVLAGRLPVSLRTPTPRRVADAG